MFSMVSGTWLSKWVPVIFIPICSWSQRQWHGLKRATKFFDVPLLYKWSLCHLPLNLGGLCVWPVQFSGSDRCLFLVLDLLLTGSFHCLLKYLLLDLASTGRENPNMPEAAPPTPPPPPCSPLADNHNWVATTYTNLPANELASWKRLL